MASNDDPAAREESRAIANFLRQFLDPDVGIEAVMKAEYEANQTSQANGSERPYMARDSGATTAAE